MKALIVILEQTSQGALGCLILDGEIFCFSLQPDVTDDHFHLPEGDYECRRFHGTKWKNTYEIVRPGADDVDGHKYLLFHSGNTEEDTEGCILLGATTGKLKGNRAVLNSGDTFKRFLEYTGNVDRFSLKVKDCINL